MVRHGRFHRFVICVLVLTVLAPVFPLLVTPALAKTYTVCPNGCNFATIAAALAAAKDGDSIQIGAGTYAGGVAIERDVDLFGAGRDQTTIQGTSQASVIQVNDGANVTIEGVTITGGGGSDFGGWVGGGGIQVNGGLTLADSVVRGNAVTRGGNPSQMVGGGIAVTSTKQLKVFNSVIRDNQAGRGGGIFVLTGEVLISDSTISGNRTINGGDGGGLWSDRSGKTVTVRRTTISDNVSTGAGGGILAFGKLVLTDSTVSNNRAAFRGGGVAAMAQELQIVRSTISGNSANPQSSQGDGGGVYMGANRGTFQDSTIENNQANRGAGIYNSVGDLTLKTTTVASNVARSRAGGIFISSSEAVLNESRVISNTAGESGGGIFANDGKLSLRNGSTVSGNQPDQCVGVDCQAASATQKQKQKRR